MSSINSFIVNDGHQVGWLSLIPCSPRFFYWKGLVVIKLTITKNVSLRPRPHYAGVIWKRRFPSKNASNVFHPHYARGILKRNNHWSLRIGVWGKLGQGNHMIFVTSLFSKSSVFKVFSVHTKTKSTCFQITLVWRASVFEKLRFRDGLVWTVGLTIELKLRSQIPPV